MAHDHVVAYMQNDDYEGMEDTFTAGANAALEELKRFMEDSPDVNFRSFNAIVNKIHQLKAL